jgi:hypothetical protein
MILYAISALSAFQLPPIRRSDDRGRTNRRHLPRRIRLIRFATAGVRFLNGYLVFLIAFAVADRDSGIAGLALLLAAAGIGYFVSAWVAPIVGSYVREEPMVVGALAVMAIAAFMAAEWTSLAAAAVLVGAAGFAWGMAKFAFDAMMHTTLGESQRARAFTNAETLFQIAWVIGALIPVLPIWPTSLGLWSAGVMALVIQVGYVSLVLIPEDPVPTPSVVVDLTAESRPDRVGVLDLI